MSRLCRRYAEDCDEALVTRVCAENGVSPLLARALIRRGVTEQSDVAAYLAPQTQALPDPYMLSDMEKAVSRIRAAIDAGERICIYGDYDADGVCATALLFSCLEQLSASVCFFLPSRHGEGYGLSCAGVDALNNDNVSLLITVDNGLSAHEEIAHAYALGMEVIVTDHHRAKDTLPDCAAVVQPGGADETPYCGAGVAYLLALALTNGAAGESALALAALATVADVVPLFGNNRVLVAKGMPLVLRNPGLAALLKLATADKGPVSETTLAYVLAPRLNAAGRMGDAARAVSLLICQEPSMCATLAAALDADNQTRRTVEAEILEDAETQIRTLPLSSLPALILCGNAWNPGVIGIVASRLVERYHRPALLFCGEGEELTGSCRSVYALDMAGELKKCSRFFVRFGGHAGAAGITMKRENFAAFSEAFLHSAAQILAPDLLVPTVYYEERLSLSELTLPAAKELMLLAPFGEGNERPRYLVEGVHFSSIKRMGKDGRHLSALAVEGDASLRLVAFSLGSAAGILETGEGFDLAAMPTVNCFRGVETAELLFCAANAQKSLDAKIEDAFWRDILYNNKVCSNTVLHFVFSSETLLCIKALKWNDERMRALYTALKAFLGTEGMAETELCALLSFEQRLALLAFVQLGFFCFDAQSSRLAAVAHPPRAPLTNSAIYRLGAGLDVRYEQQEDSPMDLTTKIRNIPDFPVQGVLFRDITTLLKDKEGYCALIDEIKDSLKGKEVDLVVGPEARGFVIGSALAYALKAGFVVARKPGKLPCKTMRYEYGLEYGSDVLEIHEDAIKPGQKVVIVDDLLATGGTALATVKLVEQAGGVVVGLRFAIELASEFDGRKPLAGYDVASVMQF